MVEGADWFKGSEGEWACQHRFMPTPEWLSFYACTLSSMRPSLSWPLCQRFSFVHSASTVRSALSNTGSQCLALVSLWLFGLSFVAMAFCERRAARFFLKHSLNVSRGSNPRGDGAVTTVFDWRVLAGWLLSPAASWLEHKAMRFTA